MRVKTKQNKTVQRKTWMHLIRIEVELEAGAFDDL